jgi:stage II sporulation protein D
VTSRLGRLSGMTKLSRAAGLRPAALAAMAAAVAVAALVAGGCTPEGTPMRAPPVGKEVPLMRVRLGEDVASLVVEVRGPWRLIGDAGEVAGGDKLDWAPVVLQDGRITVGTAPPVTGSADLVSEHDGTIWIRQAVGGTPRERAYRGSVRFVITSGGLIRVVNVVPMEAYLAGVLANELPKPWHVEAYKALAVAARTYALQERMTRKRSDSDVSDSTASQVYGGCQTETRTAWEAIKGTWGVVGSYPGAGGKPTLFLMYYSSTCGGLTTGATAAFGDVAPPPLIGGVTCTYCQQSPKFRWPDVALTKQEVADAMHRSGAPELVSLGPIVTVEVAERNGPNQRATLIRVIGKSGTSVLVQARLWRGLVGASKVPSTWFDIEDAGDRIILKNGRGSGHGVGLCQWGAQYLAEHGKTGEEILRYYYPGVVLVRAY